MTLQIICVHPCASLQSHLGVHIIALRFGRDVMSSYRLVSFAGRGLGSALGAVIAALTTASAPAQTPVQPDISARLVPANVSFYSASLRTREQFEIFTKSRAFAALKQMPAV